MLAENKEIFDPDQVRLVFRVMFLDMGEYFYFCEGLLGELGSIFDDLHCQKLFLQVVKNFKDLPIRSTPYHVKYFKSIANVVMFNNYILFSVLTFKYCSLSNF